MKKLLFVLALVLCLGVSAFALDGEGTQESPFVITNVEELMLISDFPDCYFNLGCDIVLEGEWTPLCTNGDAFSAVFDGCGYTIYNLELKKAATNPGLITINNGTIKNLNITTTEEYTYTYASEKSYGIICGKNNGLIENCHVKGKIVSRGSGDADFYAGGITGTNTGTIVYCSSDVYMDTPGHMYYEYRVERYAFSYSGGIAGKNINGTISFCSANVELSGTRSYKSGITNYGTVSNCYAIGTGAEYGIGYSITKSENCYAAITGSSYGIGGNSSEKINCFFDQTIATDKTSNYGTPKTTAAMKMKLTYTKAGWDFDNVWGISKEINDGYPYLLWEYPEKEEDVLTETEAYEHDGKLVFDVSIYANAPSKITQIGLYGEGGRFIRSFMIPNFDSKKDITVVIDNEEDAVSAKIFVWENTESIKPLADCEEVQIVRNET